MTTLILSGGPRDGERMDVTDPKDVPKIIRNAPAASQPKATSEDPTAKVTEPIESIYLITKADSTVEPYEATYEWWTPESSLDVEGPMLTVGPLIREVEGKRWYYATTVANNPMQVVLEHRVQAFGFSAVMEYSAAEAFSDILFPRLDEYVLKHVNEHGLEIAEWEDETTRDPLIHHTFGEAFMVFHQDGGPIGAMRHLISQIIYWPDLDMETGLSAAVPVPEPEANPDVDPDQGITVVRAVDEPEPDVDRFGKTADEQVEAGVALPPAYDDHQDH